MDIPEQTIAPRVLIIDDDPVIRMIVREALAATEFDVMEASEPEVGFDMASSYRPELIILDIMMPRIDGLELLSQIRMSGIDSRVLVFSATGSYHAEKAVQLGASGFIAKPFELVQFLGEILRVLTLPRWQAA